jgi:hypothetical protein
MMATGGAGAGMGPEGVSAVLAMRVEALYLSVTLSPAPLRSAAFTMLCFSMVVLGIKRRVVLWWGCCWTRRVTTLLFIAIQPGSGGGGGNAESTSKSSSSEDLPGEPSPGLLSKSPLLTVEGTGARSSRPSLSGKGRIKGTLPIKS